MQAFSLQLTWSLNLLYFDMCINCLYFPGLEKWISLLQRSLATSRAESWPFSFSTPAGKHTHSALTLCQLHSRLERGNFRNSEEVGRRLGWTRENAANPYHVKLEVVVFVVVWSGKTRFSNLDVCDWRGKLEWLLVCTLSLSLSISLSLSPSPSLSLFDLAVTVFLIILFFMSLSLAVNETEHWMAEWGGQPCLTFSPELIVSNEHICLLIPDKCTLCFC